MPFHDKIHLQQEQKQKNMAAQETPVHYLTLTTNITSVRLVIAPRIKDMAVMKF